jgi:predicted HicB family RNase H-like nuclease
MWQRMSTKMIVIALPEDLHTRVKVKAAETKQTLKAFVIDALQQAVRPEPKTGVKKTAPR